MLPFSGVKLAHVSIENFRSIKKLEFDFPESGLFVLVGANNAGKSNIITAIDAICGDGWFGPDKMEDHDHYLRDRDRQVRIELSFDDGKTAFMGSKWPEYRDKYGQKIYKPSVKDDFPCTYLGADRTLDKHLSFHDWTLIGKIRRAFHRRASSLESDLHAKFQDLAGLFDKVEGFQDFKRDVAGFFAELQADTPTKLAVDFKPFTPSNFFKNMQLLALDPNQSSQPLDLDELGDGTRNMVLLALLRSYAVNFRGSPEGVSGLLALEEPEIFLHPQARRHLFKVLCGIAETGFQVIISTHSASFVDTEIFDSIGQVYKVPDPDAPGRTHTALTGVTKERLVGHCIATGVPAAKVTVANVGEFYKTTSNYRLNEAFFARFIVLVEGETEELAIPEYLKGAGLDCDRQGISMIAVGGKNQIPKYSRLFALFNPRLLVIFDNDDDGEGSKRQSNQNLVECFGLQLDDVINGVDVFRTLEAKVSPKHAVIVLGQDFEAAIRKDFARRYPEAPLAIKTIEDEARALIKPVGDQSKAQMARFLARRLRESHPEFVPGFIEQVAEIIKQELQLAPTVAEVVPPVDEDDVPF